MLRVLFWVIFLPLLVIVVVFAVNNHQMTAVDLWPVLEEPLPWPVYGIVLVSLVAGFLWGAVVAWLQGHGSRQRARTLHRNLQQKDLEIAAMRERVDKVAATESAATIPAPRIAAPTDA